MSSGRTMLVVVALLALATVAARAAARTAEPFGGQRGMVEDVRRRRATWGLTCATRARTG